MPDEYGRSFNEYGQRYVGTVKRNSSAGTQGYWSTDTGRGPDWGLIFAILYGVYKLFLIIYRAISRRLQSPTSADTASKSFAQASGQNSYGGHANALCVKPDMDLVAETGVGGVLIDNVFRKDRILALKDQTPLEIARACGFCYKSKNGGSLLVDYFYFKEALKRFTSKNNRIFLENMQLYGPLLGASVDSLNKGIKRLSGDNLLDLLRLPASKQLTKSELAVAAGYNFIAENWKEKIDYTSFYHAILKAKGVAIPPVMSNPESPSRDRASSEDAIQSPDQSEIDRLLLQAEESLGRSANSYVGGEYESR